MLIRRLMLLHRRCSPAPYPVAVPGTSDAGYSIYVFDVALRPQGSTLMKTRRVQSVYLATVLNDCDSPSVHLLQALAPVT